MKFAREKSNFQLPGKGKASWYFEDKGEFCLQECMDIIIPRYNINGNY